MHAFGTPSEILRRAPWTIAADRPRLSLVKLLLCLCAFGLFYGGVMGLFRLLEGEEAWLLQVVYSAVKVPLLLVITFLITLPSFFVLNTLLGLRNDFGTVIRAHIATQASLAIILASLAPFTIFWYASSGNYQAALMFNAAMFAIASFAAQAQLRAYYRPLVKSNSKHTWMLRAWICIYAVIGIQMGWLLRPFIGSPGSEVQFLRPEAWDNAFVLVARMFWNLLFG